MGEKTGQGRNIQGKIILPTLIYGFRPQRGMLELIKYFILYYITVFLFLYLE